MLRARHSNPGKKNGAVTIMPRRQGESNKAWLERAGSDLGSDTPKVILMGGTSVADFRLRVAQSHSRRDMKPSFWSHAGVLLPGRGKQKWQLWHVPLEVPRGLGEVPSRNGVERASLTYCSSQDRWPNLALLEFGGVVGKEVSAQAKRMRQERLSIDLVTPLVQWLAFVWGASGAVNPLLVGTAMPSASYVEAIYASLDVDLAPGMADRTHCPEAFWQSAKWWSNYYGSEDPEAGPRGRFVIGQGAAAVVDH